MALQALVNAPSAIYSESGGLVKNAVLVVDKTRREVAQAYESHDRVEFNVWPEEISDSASPNWESVEILGRSEPFQIYANTGPRTISVDFMFFAQGSMTKNESIAEAIDREVMRNVRFLRSLAYPIKGEDGLVRRPATCWLRLGELLTSRVIMAEAPAVVYEGPWEPDTVLPYQAKVSCTFTEVNRVPKDASSVRSGLANAGEALAARFASLAFWQA